MSPPLMVLMDDLRDRFRDLWLDARVAAADDLRRVAGWTRRRADSVDDLAARVDIATTDASGHLERWVVRGGMTGVTWVNRNPEAARFALEVQGWKAKAKAFGLDDDVVDRMVDEVFTSGVANPMDVARYRWEGMTWRATRSRIRVDGKPLWW